MSLWDKLYQLTGNIGADMLEPIGYIPWGILLGCIFLLLLKIWDKVHLQEKESISGEKKWVLFLCIVYSTVLLNLVFFSREPGSREGMDRGFFETWGTDLTSHAYFIENVLMFLPFGILFPSAFPKLRKGRICLVAGLLASIFLESIQLLTQRGFCQLDDVVTNTVGAVLGWSIYTISIRQRKKHD